MALEDMLMGTAEWLNSSSQLAQGQSIPRPMRSQPIHWEYIDDQRINLIALLQTTEGRNVKHTGFTRHLTHFLTAHKVTAKFERGEIEEAALNGRRMVWPCWASRRVGAPSHGSGRTWRP